MYISRDEALMLIKITSRQGLHKFVKKHNIRTKNEGNGHPTFYNKDDLLKAYSTSYKKKVKYNPAIEQKASKIEKKYNQNKNKMIKEKAEAIKKDGEILDEVGQSELLRVEKILKDKGVFDNLDRSLLLSYAIAYSNYIYYVTLSRKLDHVSMDFSGNIKTSPYLGVADKFFKQMTTLSNTLGIGARSRIGLEIKAEKKDSIFDMLGKEEF